MKISLEWLADYVALPGTADALADALTAGGTEVVGRMTRGDVPDKVVVAQILSSEQHPNADRLSVCQVDDGSGQPRQIVCGAKNYRVGDKVPLALPGAVLGPDFKIKSGKLRGVASEGMMCSAKELALADDAEGLMILPADSTVGRPVRELFPPNTLLELEVTPNRPDMLGYLGVARELSALTGAALTGNAASSPPLPPVATAEPGRINIEDAGCAFYSARIIRGVKIGPSPAWLADRLAAVGLRPINNVVDVTNYVLMETGQPLHAFDLAKLSGGIVVRAARDGETLHGLDGITRQLRPHDLVIADQSGAVALAGVMGGAETGVEPSTVDLLLESAWFEPSRVRRTSRELGCTTDSSYRFERRVNPEGVLAASARATGLILETAGGTPEAGVFVAGELPREEREIALDYGHCRDLLGLEIGDEEIDAILVRLGLERKDRGTWRIPAFRPDLTRAVDLIEEVIRVAGIERVPSRLRGFPAAASLADLRHDRAEVLRSRLRAQGFSEARTSHFVSAEALAEAGVPAAGAVAIRNPLGADQAFLRPVLRAGLLGAMAHNFRHGARSVRLFELGQVFSTEGREECTALGLIASGEARAASWKEAGTPADFHDLKGVLECVLGPLAFDASDGGGLAMRVSGESGVQGTIQRLPKTLAQDHEARSPVYYAELIVGPWLELVSGDVRVRNLPKFPAVERDLSIVLPRGVPYADIEAALRRVRVPHLETFALKDVFTDAFGEALPADRRALTVALTFRDASRTLTSDEIDRAVETLRDHAKAELGADFRA
ncbi:MAG: phenylalanine--tRNA ligase subunit beta [Chthoniobacterales bacterium]|nr:phenylalanine--tRNA ligase subunit beta [Chthoniobacterales bacterium]